LVKYFDINKLEVSWFSLPTNHINCFPDSIFNLSIERLLQHNIYDKQIDFNDIQNILSSNRCNQFRDILEVNKFRVRISKRNKKTKSLKNIGIPYTEYSDHNNSYRQDSQSRLNNGILTINDKKIISELKLKPDEVASYSDGFHSSLSDLKLFQLFPKKEVKRSIKPILFNAIVGKVNTINYFHSLYFFPGNTLKLINDYKIETNFYSFYESFINFLELSMFEISSNKLHDQEV
jgi:hypothetical protein